MPKNLKITIKNTKQNAKKIECIFEGNHHQDHCLFIGPWSIYSHTFSEETKKLFTFIGIDYFFSKSKYMASKKESIELSRTQLSGFYNNVLYALQEKHRIGEKVFIIAPSALGFVALEYARFFPNQVKGVILIGMPDNLKDIKYKQDLFFLNYSPLFFKNFPKTNFIHDKWHSNASNIKKYSPILNDNSTSDITKYIAELKRDEEKYYTNMDENGAYDASRAKKMYAPWENINIHFRNYFFESFMSDYNPKNIKKVTVPVFAAIGCQSASKIDPLSASKIDPPSQLN